ncbi:hypothetical protein KVG96_23230 [Pseudomonas sp. COR58]|uniref:Uncharacterized protein n=1 Tax=Pseudomonas ekonensis TaxID=2842353 RepID=A0ABS6PLG2_9PSED|nr:hypothetical protein [Pseudomonas ekonensis]MBV4460877.1 hypothetical protein [Pseudomonas ekonensis]
MKKPPLGAAFLWAPSGLRKDVAQAMSESTFTTNSCLSVPVSHAERSRLRKIFSASGRIRSAVQKKVSSFLMSCIG